MRYCGIQPELILNNFVEDERYFFLTLFEQTHTALAEIAFVAATWGCTATCAACAA